MGSGPALVRSPASIRGTVLVRSTAPDALSNLVAVLELTADGQMRCSAATRRPLTATVRLVQDALVAGDYYDAADLEAAHHDSAHHDRAHHDRAHHDGPTTMAPGPSRHSRGRCSCRPAAWRGWPEPGSS